MTQNPTWRFRTMADDQKHVEPTHREHLAPGGSVEPLVRESIQNSLDVTLPGQPTKVAFTLGSVSSSSTRDYFHALWPHLESITRALPDGLPNANDAIRFLAIEDYNTTGLTGDPTVRSETMPDSSKNHFFRFWHRVGQAAEFKRRGSWGVGKVVFSNASAIRTFFGMTLRGGDAFPLLMGEAGLIIHRLPASDDTYEWYGYFASHRVDRPGNGAERHVVLPVQDPEFVRLFEDTFSLTRTSCGLSIVVPYVRNEVKLNDLARVVIEQYFLSIITGRLEVILREGDREISISHRTIDGVVPQLTWSSRATFNAAEVTKMLDLARWQNHLASDEYVLLKAVGDSGSYNLTANSFPSDSLHEISNEYALNNRVALRIPVHIRPRDGPATLEEVRLVLERDESLKSNNVPHLRSGINISKLRSQGPQGVRGILSVGNELDENQGDLDKLLQASEGPAHINWELQGDGYDKAKSLYPDAHRVLRFMRSLVRNVVQHLASPQGERDTRTLAPFFPDSSAEGTGDGGSVGKRRGTGAKETPAPPLLPAGVLEVAVKSLNPVLRAMHPIEGASLQLFKIDSDGPQPHSDSTTDSDGKSRFEHLAAGDYQITANKPDVGVAQITIALPADNGLRKTSTTYDALNCIVVSIVATDFLSPYPPSGRTREALELPS